MSTGSKKKEHYDEWEGIDLNKAFTFQESQCEKCKNLIGTSACKIFGKRPYKYASVSANVKCPERKKK